MFPRSTHETFAQKLYQTFRIHKRFTKPKLSRSDFTNCHYANDVTYQTEFFLDKNKDYVIAEHQALLSASKCSVSGLFSISSEESSSKQSKFSSIVSWFKSVLGIILGGGARTRNCSLTKKRAKSAVPLGANYQLIDILVNNCLNSNISKIYVLTQFNSASLNHHLSRAYASNMGGYKNEGFV